MADHDLDTLELFVLGELPARADPEDLRSHLASCAGCRMMEGQMRNFYEALDEEERHAAGREPPLPSNGAAHSPQL